MLFKGKSGKRLGVSKSRRTVGTVNAVLSSKLLQILFTTVVADFLVALMMVIINSFDCIPSQIPAAALYYVSDNGTL